MRKKGLSLKRKITNILLLVGLLAIAVGIYYNIYNSRAEDVIELEAVAVDNYGYLENEGFTLKANLTEENLYEIELPESVNTKKVNQFYEITLEDSENSEAEKEILTVTDNKIIIEQEKLKNKKINVNVSYDVAILTKNEKEAYEKTVLADKTPEEIASLEITEEMEVLYSKILKHEDEENAKLVEVRGYLPKKAELQVEEVAAEEIQGLLEDEIVNVAYDIKILLPVIKEEVIQKEDGTEDIVETVEYIEMNPEDFGEKCEVTIKDVNIETHSNVYHIKDDNTVEQIEVKDNTEENVKFEATNFSVYAVTTTATDSTGEDEDSVLEGLVVKISPSGNTTWSQSHSVKVLATLHTEVTENRVSNISYAWSTSNEIKPSVTTDIASGTEITISNVTGKYYLWVFVTTVATMGSSGTSTHISNEPFYVDNTAPQLQATITKTTSGKNINIAITDAHSGVLSTNEYQYYLSTSATALEGGVWTEYTPETDFTIENQTGTKYLFIKTVQDVAGNISETETNTNYNATTTEIDGITYHRYTLDFASPILTVTPETETTETKQKTINIAATDEGTGLYSNTYQYYLSTSDTTLEGGTWTTYTNKTDFLIGEDLNGTYYLFVKGVKDAQSNGSTTEGTIITVNETSYHRFGPYVFKNPTITFEPNENTTWSKSQSTIATGIAIDESTLKYKWTTSTTAPEESEFEETFTTGTEITKANVTGKYYLWAMAKDEEGNTVISGSEAFYLDNVKPTITINKNETNGTLTIIAAEVGGGLSSSNSYQYYLSTSNTVLEGGEWIDYVSGTENTLTLSEGTYLFVKTISDSAGNISNNYGEIATIDGTDYHMFTVSDATEGITVNISPNGNTTWSQSQTATVTISDNKSTITASDYGGYVTNYTASNGANVGWRIFYADESNIYLIADDYIDRSYVPTGKGSTTVTTSSKYTKGFGFSKIVSGYTGLSDISNNIANKWLNQYITSGYTSTNANMKATAYLLDTDVWSGFKDDTFSEYAIGGPTLELFRDSYNTTHTNTQMQTIVNSELGYQLRLNGGSYDVGLAGLVNTPESLYIISDDTYATGMWMATPSAGNASTLKSANYQGVMQPAALTTTVFGARPIVCIKSGIEIEKQEDGTYKLAEDAGINKESLKYVWRKASEADPTAEEITEALVIEGTTTENVDETTGKLLQIKTPIEKDALTGQYKLWVYVEDTAGNSQIVGSEPFCFDNTEPTITFTQDTTDACKVTIDVEDENGGLSTDNTYRYYLSTSATTLEGGEALEYFNGTEITLTTVGKRYLWVNQASDAAGNISSADSLATLDGTSYQLLGEVVLDNVAPTITISPNENLEWKQSHSATVTIADEGTGLVADAQIQYAWSLTSTIEPTSWNTITITGYTTGALEASTTITATALKGTYYLWIKPLSVQDISGNSAITVTSGAFNFDNTAPMVSFNPNGNNTWKKEQTVTVTVTEQDFITAETLTEDDYGGYVINYYPENGISDDSDSDTYIGWRIFHADGENIYLIADDYVDIAYVPTGKNGTAVTTNTENLAGGFALTPYEDYVGSSDIASNLANNWLSKSIGTTISTNTNMKATAYLLDTNKWSGFGNSSYAEYAVGGPTLELFTASYNAIYETDIETQANEIGYQLKLSTDTAYANVLDKVFTTESLYKISSANAQGMWLASPSASDTNAMLNMHDSSR